MSRKREFPSVLMSLTLFLGLILGCAPQQIIPPEPPQPTPANLEAKVDSLGKRLLENIRYRDIALSNLALVDESSLGKREQNYLSAFILDRLRYLLTQNNFSLVDIKTIHFRDLLENRPLSLPQTTCEQKEFPQVILFLNIRDYGPNSDHIYLTLTAKRTDSNKLIEGIALEEKLEKTAQLLAMLEDTVPVEASRGTKENPFADLSLGAQYLAEEICCPYQELLQKWAEEGLEGEKINPQEITVMTVAINQDGSEKIGEFERRLTAKLKHFLIKNCQIENTVDFSDLVLLDRKIAFYEKEGSFKLDFTASNRERFKPASVLLIAETHSEGALRDVMLRAAWVKGETETSFGGGIIVGGTYLKGFAASAYFKEEDTLARKIRVHLSFNEDPGAKMTEELAKGLLVKEGYWIVGANEPADIVIEGEIASQRCFEGLDPYCYDFYLRKLVIKDGRGTLLRSFPVWDRGGIEKYVGHSQPAEGRDQAIRSGVGMLWDRLKNDLSTFIRGSLHNMRD